MYQLLTALLALELVLAFYATKYYNQKTENELG